MSDVGLRERKKRQTRRHIADTAARLFGERGYEHVAVADVARAADVSEQTVYNYFPTKRDLVFDLEEDLQARLSELIRTRAPSSSPAAAIRNAAFTWVEGIRDIPVEQQRGGLDYLVAVSPEVRRLCLEMTDRLADALAVAITETSPGVNPQLAKVEAIALAWVFQTITDESGRRKLAGQGPSQIVEELRPVVESILDGLDGWLAPGATPRQAHGRAAKRPASSTHR